ncbi:MAG: SRPBCC family protein [Bacteroidetes bacterium]|nr:SRPBCC family protein [Bacteroidota bacterium]
MGDASYHFISRWKVKSTKEEVYDVLGDADGLARWWPSVYLDVKILKPGDAMGVGKMVELYTKGWLPYTLRWSFEVTAVDKPTGFTIIPYGDFSGRGIWTFEQDSQNPEYCDIVYDWKIKAVKPLLKKLTFLVRPIFSANHLWAMKKGEESLKLELERRAAARNGKTQDIARPPRPTFPHNLTNNKIL